MKRIFDTYGFAIGVILISLITLVQNFSLLPVSQPVVEKQLNNYVENNIQKSIAIYHDYADNLENAAFSIPIYVYQDERLIFWTDPSYMPPVYPSVGRDTIYKYQSNGSQGLIKIHPAGERILVIRIPVISGGKYLPDRGFSCLRPKSHLTSISFGQQINIDLEEKKLCHANPYFIWFNLFILLIGAILIFPKFQIFIKKNKIFEKSGQSNLFLILLNIIMLPTAFLPLFEGHWFTASMGGHEFSPLTPLLIVCFSGFLLIFLTTIPVNKKLTRAFVSTGWKKYLFGLLSYLLIGIWGACMIIQYEYIYKLSGIDLHLEQLFSFSVMEIAFLIIFILIFVVFFSFCQFIYKLIHLSKIQLAQKLPGIITTGVFLFLIHSTGLVKIDPAFLILSYLILIISFDLYQDRKSLNSTWIFTWMILISAYVSFMIFSIDYNNDELRLTASLDNIIQERDRAFEANFKAGNKHLNDETFIFEWVELEPADYYTLRKRYIPVGKDLFFNPLTGDYFSAVEFLEANTISVQHFYTNKALLSNWETKEVPEKYLLLYKGEKMMDLFDNNLSDQFKTHFTNRDTTQLFEKGYALHFLHGHDELSILHIKKLPGLLRPVSLFSLIFFILSIILFLLSLINTRFKILPPQLNLQFFGKKSLRNRIQISIISLIIVSFFIIGIVTNYYLKNLAENTDQVIQTSQIELLQNELQTVLLKDDWTPDETILKNYSLFQSIENGRLIHFFDNNGIRLEDERNFLTNSASSNQMKMIPYRSLLTLDGSPGKSNIWVNFGNIRGVIFPIRKDAVSVINAFAFVPGKHERFSLQNISNIFATFLNIYSFLFIISGGIAIALANSITNPIEILGKKLKGLKLSNKNETVQWKNEDEIGALISIYNEMIHKLSDNAQIMAKVERDSAWKEMAKQVAHEIKNPLTPLKLNIQYLESKVRMNPEAAPGLIEQIAPSLIEQIDNLSEIASEFSNFAQLPAARNEKIRLNEIVKTVHDFFRKREDLTFQLFVPINDVLVFADKNHLVSIMNNVVKNAIQSIPSDRQGEIILRLYRNEGNAIIQVTDNGSGIPKEMHEKVFSPNFTTKSSGTGLGLAISTNMLESFNGRIYFKTIENVGTDFFIEIPLMRFTENFPDATRVLLDD